MAFVTLPFAAGVARDESPLAAKPAYINADKVRAVAGKMETIYGQELACGTALTGVCRGAHAWADLARTAWAAFGTHQRLQVIDQDGILYDATPVADRATLTNPFTLSSGSATIVVTDDGHGLIVDQLITFPAASSAANVLIAGGYVVSSVMSSSAFSITASTAALSTAGVGGTVDIEYGLAPGHVSNLGGLGYVTGGYGAGGYGGPSSAQELGARTWSFANWGQNLIANPAWGGIYEWAPHISAAELIAGGDFASTAGWVLGAGWSIAAGTSSASAGADLAQDATLVRSAWHLLRFDVLRNAGTVQPLIGGSSVGAAISVSGTYKRVFFAPTNTAQSLVFAGGGAFNGRIDNVSLKVLTTAAILPGAPSSAGSVFVTAERNLVACGCTNPGTGLLDPIRVAWSAQENNQDWTASAANVAGSYVLSHGTRIVRGLACNRENLIFTDTAVYRMRAVPDPSVVYAFDLLGEGCGLAGPNAAIQAGGMVFWISSQAQFYQYTGGLPVPLRNPSARDLRDNLADVQGTKIAAGHLAARSEVWWFYPDERDGIECSRYHVFSYADQTWVSGLYDRSAFVDAGPFPYPLATDSSGHIYYQEKDFSNDGAARATTLESSYFTVGDGDGFTRIMGVRPDFDDLKGGVQLTFYSKNYPQDPVERSYGPYSITPATRRLSVRINGRQVRFKVTTDDAPSFYRLAAMTFDVRAGGQKK